MSPLFSSRLEEVVFWVADRSRPCPATLTCGRDRDPHTFSGSQGQRPRRTMGGKHSAGVLGLVDHWRSGHLERVLEEYVSATIAGCRQPPDVIFEPDSPGGNLEPSAARIIRSAGSRSGRLTSRRRTATWWRRARISRSRSASELLRKTAKLIASRSSV